MVRMTYLRTRDLEAAYLPSSEAINIHVRWGWETTYIKGSNLVRE